MGRRSVSAESQVTERRVCLPRVKGIKVLRVAHFTSPSLPVPVHHGRNTNHHPWCLNRKVHAHEKCSRAGRRTIIATATPGSAIAIEKENLGSADCQGRFRLGMKRGHKTKNARCHRVGRSWWKHSSSGGDANETEWPRSAPQRWNFQMSRLKPEVNCTEFWPERASVFQPHSNLISHIRRS